MKTNNHNICHDQDFMTRMMAMGVSLILLLFATLPSKARGKYDNTDTLVVATDGSGEFRTIGEAVEVCRAFMEYRKVIFIKKGIYKEKLTIPSWLTNIEMVGEDAGTTVITNDDHANLPRTEQGATGKMGTFRTYTLKVEGSNITIRNITIENNAPMLGQAVALHTEGDRIRLRGCRLLGNQDTVYTGVANTRIFFEDCYIEGTTDFLFGPSTAWFENCEIHNKSNSYITAASTPQDVTYGYVFNHCRLTAAEGVDKAYLGRPWRAYAHTLFMNCYMGKHITPAGWENWKDYHDPAIEGTVRYQEYNNHGKGADTSERVIWSRQLSDQEAASITMTTVFGEDARLW